MDEKTQAENQTAREADDFPWMNRDPEHMRLGEKLKAVHKGRFRQGGTVYKPPGFLSSLISARGKRRNPMPEIKPPMWRIALATTPEQIGRCSSVMRELRPHIKAIDFAARVLKQQKEGYQLAYLELDQVVRSVAGFRIFDLLFSGRTLYIDDLVTHDSDRSRGFGAALFDWLVEYAKENGCAHLTLDSGVQRFAAHRFYLNRGMDITSHHFDLKLNS